MNVKETKKILEALVIDFDLGAISIPHHKLQEAVDAFESKENPMGFGRLKHPYYKSVIRRLKVRLKKLGKEERR